MMSLIYVGLIDMFKLKIKVTFEIILLEKRISVFIKGGTNGYSK